VLPTRQRVEALIEHVRRDPQESLGAIPPKGGDATIEKLAINAVMGGCRPAHFPVVILGQLRECRAHAGPHPGLRRSRADGHPPPQRW
jgi:hypothetical protein